MTHPRDRAFIGLQPGGLHIMLMGLTVPLVAAKPIVATYLLITLAAATRVFAPMVAPAMPQATWTIAGILWITAFLLYCAVYAPVLWRPRSDGRPG